MYSKQEFDQNYYLPHDLFLIQSNKVRQQISLHVIHVHFVCPVISDTCTCTYNHTCTRTYNVYIHVPLTSPMAIFPSFLAIFPIMVKIDTKMESFVVDMVTVP